MSFSGFMDFVSSGANEDGYFNRIVYGPPRFPNDPSWVETRHYASVFPTEETFECLLQRAWDSGNEDYVYWLTAAGSPDTTPVVTFPMFTGVLSAYSIILTCKPEVLSYYQRAFDSGTNGYVYWSSVTPDPSPGVTVPAFTGSLSAHEIVYIYYV